jgi:hypothetical protein
MSRENTTIIDLQTTSPTLERSPVSGSDVAIPGRLLAGKASDEDREAILRSLYAERSTLTRAKRVGRFTASDAEYLADLNQYIDRWEAPERQTQSDDNPVWSKLEALAESVVGIEAEIGRRSK